MQVLHKLMTNMICIHYLRWVYFCQTRKQERTTIMPILDLSFDEVLTTTRAVRNRLDLTRPVEAEVIRECLSLAVQAPTPGGMQNWHFIVVTDPSQRKALAALYRKATRLPGGQEDILKQMIAAAADQQEGAQRTSRSCKSGLSRWRIRWEPASSPPLANRWILCCIGIAGNQKAERRGDKVRFSRCNRPLLPAINIWAVESVRPLKRKGDIKL